MASSSVVPGDFHPVQKFRRAEIVPLRATLERGRSPCGSMVVFRARQVFKLTIRVDFWREDIMSRVQALRASRVVRLLAPIGVLLASALPAASQNRPPWPPGDEIGMANILGPATW